MKRYIIVFLATVIMVMLSACGGNTEEIKPAEVHKEEVSEEIITEETEITIAEEGPVNVMITIPKRYFEDKSEEEILNYAKDSGINECLINSDGSVTYKMTVENHKKVLNGVDNQFNEVINDYIYGENKVESIVDIGHNDVYSQIKVYVDSEKYSLNDNLYGKVFFEMGIYYQLFSGADEDDIDVNVCFIDVETEEVMYEMSYRNMNESLEDTENNDKSSENSEYKESNSFEQGVLYKEDFEIPDCRGLGYTNIVDFYNDYPNGKTGGTFGNAGVFVHYRDDIDMDMSVEESLSFRTYRGIGLGDSMDKVFEVYGVEDIRPPFEELSGLNNDEHTISCFVDYDGRIESGALVGIRFYFDQNNTVMYIDYGATYAQYVSSTNVKDVVIN